MAITVCEDQPALLATYSGISEPVYRLRHQCPFFHPSFAEHKSGMQPGSHKRVTTYNNSYNKRGMTAGDVHCFEIQLEEPTSGVGPRRKGWSLYQCLCRAAGEKQV